MEFGKLRDISKVDWALPSEDPGNSKRLRRSASSQVFFGAPAWGSKHWIGKIYPAKTPAEKFLYYHARAFNCIELNATHYRIPNARTTSKWLSQVPDGFVFCPKLHKDISHTRGGLLDRVLLKDWCDFLRRLQSHLGPCFIQLNEMFTYRSRALLFQFLESWPSEFRLSLELRHGSWFRHGVVLPALADYLSYKNIGLVITDVAGRRDVLHSTLSSYWTMIRLIGNHLDPRDAFRLELWADRIKL